MIKPKIGQCVDCPKDAEYKPLISKRCVTGPYFHYQKHKQSERAGKQRDKNRFKSLKDASSNGLTLGQWFNNQILIMPRECENCLAYLNPYAPWSSRAYIAHIVPKRHFNTVATHEMNRLFLCIDCHTNYDNWLNKDIVNMPCWPLAVSRFNSFKHLISDLEYKHLRDVFKDLMK